MRRSLNTIGAIGCAVACALCVAAYTGSVQSEAEASRAQALARYGGEQVEVCVATRTISPGEEVDARCVETRLWVADLLPDGAVSDLQDLAGKKASGTIYAGEVLVTHRFDATGSALSVPVGYAAVSVPAEEVNVVGGAVTVGSRVDMYATGASSTELLASDVLVLATSAMGADGTTGSDLRWVTLAVAPEAVQEVIAAAQGGRLDFALPSTGEGVSLVGQSAEATATQGAPPVVLPAGDWDTAGEAARNKASEQDQSNQAASEELSGDASPGESESAGAEAENPEAAAERDEDDESARDNEGVEHEEEQ